MVICYSSITTCSRNAIHIKKHLGTRLAQQSYKFSCNSLSSELQNTTYGCFRVSVSKTQSRCLDNGLTGSGFTIGPKRKLEVSFLSSNMRNLYWDSRFVYTGVIVSLLVCYSSTSQSVYAEASNNGGCNNSSDGKRIYTDYSIIGIPGDGRCLFRSVVHGFCLRSGKLAPDENVQRKLADELRNRVADEFVNRREETEWFVEGDFDTYVKQIRKPHVWGGEPELFMASHVLQMPITVYMKDEKAGGLIIIAEYGQEYTKEDPIPVLFHGFGHYDALLIHQTKSSFPKSKL